MNKRARKSKKEETNEDKEVEVASSERPKDVKMNGKAASIESTKVEETKEPEKPMKRPEDVHEKKAEEEKSKTPAVEEVGLGKTGSGGETTNEAAPEGDTRKRKARKPNKPENGQETKTRRNNKADKEEIKDGNDDEPKVATGGREDIEDEGMESQPKATKPKGGKNKNLSKEAESGGSAQPLAERKLRKRLRQASSKEGPEEQEKMKASGNNEADDDAEIPEVKPKRQRSAVAATFARRACPKSVNGKMKWEALRRAFETYIKSELKAYSAHEDSWGC